MNLFLSLDLLSPTVGIVVGCVEYLVVFAIHFAEGIDDSVGPTMASDLYKL